MAERWTLEAAGPKARRYERKANATAHQLFYFWIVEIVAVKLGDGHFAFADSRSRGSRGAVGQSDPNGVASAELES